MVNKHINNYFRELKVITENLSLDKFELILNGIFDAYKRGNKIFIMGNGGSAATASHFTCDINKSVSHGPQKRFQVICLNDNIPTMLAYANDKSYEDVFVEQLRNFLAVGDVVIGISGSGNSKNVLKAVKYAKENGGITLAFTGFNGGELAKTADISLIVPSNDMQKVEDMHLIMTHIIMQIFYKKIREEK